MLSSDQFSGQLLGGIALLVIGMCILLADALNTPPALRQLMQVDLPLSGTVRVVRGERGGAYIAVPLGGMRGEVRHPCSQADCAIPESFAVLQSGAIVSVWLDNRAIWQMQYQNQLLVDYAEVRADYQYGRRVTMGVALLLISAGAVLFHWGRRPAPAPVGLF